MRRALVVARTEYLRAVRTKGFIIGVLLMPVLMSSGLPVATTCSMSGKFVMSGDPILYPSRCIVSRKSTLPRSHGVHMNVMSRPRQYACRSRKASSDSSNSTSSGTRYCSPCSPCRGWSRISCR